VLFEIRSTGLNVDTTKPTNVERARLYDEDCVELVLAPSGRYAKKYDEIELGPRGHFLDLRIDRLTRQGDVAWSSGLEVKTVVDEAAHTARIEAKFTASDIVSALKPGAEIPLGLFRMEGTSPRSYLAWSPPRTKTPDFHVFEAFGRLVVIDDTIHK
jgi:hypothetical protein